MGSLCNHFGIVFEENSVTITSHDHRDVIIFEKLHVQNVYGPHANAKLAFLNFSGLKTVSGELRFRDGLAWMVGLIVQIKLRF